MYPVAPATTVVLPAPTLVVSTIIRMAENPTTGVIQQHVVAHNHNNTFMDFRIMMISQKAFG